MNKINEFILKSRKIYAILGAGITICICVLTANISYGIGQMQTKSEQPTGYSQEYLEAYGLHMWAYGEIGETENTAKELSKQVCDLFIGK